MERPVGKFVTRIVKIVAKRIVSFYYRMIMNLRILLIDLFLFRLHIVRKMAVKDFIIRVIFYIHGMLEDTFLGSTFLPILSETSRFMI